MGVAFSGSPREKTYVSLNLVSCVLATLCSITVLYLIRRLKLNNGHILLIWTMSWFQLFYDVTLFFGTVYVGSEGFYCIVKSGNFFGGIGSSLITNVIAFVSYYVIAYGQVVDIRKHFVEILGCVMIPCSIDALLFVMSCSSARYSYLGPLSSLGMYYYLRIGSIVLNIIICSATAFQIYLKRSKSARLSPAELALRKLALRLVYYPVVQLVSRSAVSFYEAEYGFNFDPNQVSTRQFIGQIFFAILTPSASYGYLAIFLLMQPKAWECLKCILTCRPYVPKEAVVVSEDTINALQRESLDPSTAVYEVDSRPTFGGGGGSTMTLESYLDDLDEDALYSVASGSGRGGASSSWTGEGGGRSHPLGGRRTTVELVSKQQA